ncbi:protein translocase subunit SecF [Candidatus Gottesmanbacteria bacterium]|nr:protein translocase subunit SecF [Candidatus Gottesmanbacteria bacterium]
MIRFSKYIWIYFFISSLVLVPGIFSLLRFGLRPAIDFTGGTLLEISFKHSVQQSVIEQVAKKDNLALVSFQKSTNNAYIIRTKPEADAKILSFQKDLSLQVSEVPIISRNETIGPVLGKELLQKALVAAALAIVAILVYVAWVFKNIKFGVSAILALVHDLLVVAGVFAILGQTIHVEVDTLFVTAVLTTMSFSVHDTIVVFDRIRELLKKGEKGMFEEIADRALTQTLGRSLVNSFTIIFMLLSLVLMGGETIRWFAVALLVGTISGTYSSPFVATPILILWDRWEKRRHRRASVVQGV